MLYESQNPHGGDIYDGGCVLDFSANVNPFGAPEEVVRAYLDAANVLHLYPDPYCRKLTEAIAAFEGVPREYVLCGAGAAELIYAFAHAVRPGRFAELAPTFAEYSLPLAGSRRTAYALSEADGFAAGRGLIRFIESARPEAFFLCDPNNPTGRAMDPETKLCLLDACARTGTLLFADECFMDLSDAGASLKPQLSRYENLIILKAFTKSFGMAGLRLGYVLSGNRALMSAVSRQTQPWNVSAPAQCAGCAALGCGDFLEKTRALIRTERPKLALGLERAGLKTYPSNVNFLLLRGGRDLGTALESRGVRLRSCANFDGLGPGFFRTAVRLPNENERLIKAVTSIPEVCLKWQ
ncbi:MAG: aminotransferase class I/II-fold pyridoxal phosphate-dependent enzyme [Clostridia bacterium]|nr:aminotransferase class I/II-fold pyridoxal phosphate-dependent enzyme [Clostridia bacterium]MBQ4341263.1 aminotransferase class I/II-fold pyridoxal phosphate-dependent enzyme [Clostridia bacterium]